MNAETIDDNTNEQVATHSVCRVIEDLQREVRFTISFESQIRKAFLLGLWYKAFPLYIIEHLEHVYEWDIRDLDPEIEERFGLMGTRYPNIFKFSFISQTGDSWHECYRQLRNMGWKRVKVHRQGGNLSYLLCIESSDQPLGYTTLHLYLKITIATCRQVQTGTKTVPVFEIQCEDLKPVDDTEESFVDLIDVAAQAQAYDMRVEGTLDLSPPSKDDTPF